MMNDERGVRGCQGPDYFIHSLHSLRDNLSRDRAKINPKCRITSIRVGVFRVSTYEG